MTTHDKKPTEKSVSSATISRGLRPTTLHLNAPLTVQFNLSDVIVITAMDITALKELKTGLRKGGE